MRRGVTRDALLLVAILLSSTVSRAGAYYINSILSSSPPSTQGACWRSPSNPASSSSTAAAASAASASACVSRHASAAQGRSSLQSHSSCRGSSRYPCPFSSDAWGSCSLISRSRQSANKQKRQGRPYHELLVAPRRSRHPVGSSFFELGAASSSASSSLDDPHRNDADLAASTTPKSPSTRRSYNWTKPTLALAVPALVGMLADPVLSLVDTAYVGRVGSMELAALGSCTSLFHLAFNAFRATTAATTSLVANSLSGASETAQDHEDHEGVIVGLETTPLTSLSAQVAATTTTAQGLRDAQRVSWISLQFGLVMGMMVWAALVAGGPVALRWMGVPMDSPLYKPASEYLYARSWAAPIVLLITVSEGIFRGHGNTVVPLVASLTAALMNLVLDPILMFRPIHWGVAGAAAATAVSQCGAAAVYGWQLVRRNLLPEDLLGRRFRLARSSTRSASPDPATTGSSTAADDATTKMNRSVIRTILGANLSMMIKQGSLLLGWAFATARATRLGPQHVAAHQVALSVWLFFALVLDGAAVSSQVLMSRAYASKDRHQAPSLIGYMAKWALIQGLLSMLVLDGLDQAVPQIFTPDKSIQALLHTIMPHLAAQQVLVSLTLVMEALAAGANQFGVLAIGTALSTIASVWQIGLQTSVDGIWSVGITALFAGRLLTACVACGRALHLRRRRRRRPR